MKEISAELEKRDVIICVKCGAIFEKGTSEVRTCPECKSEMALRWITIGHSWLLKGKD